MRSSIRTRKKNVTRTVFHNAFFPKTSNGIIPHTINKFFFHVVSFCLFLIINSSCVFSINSISEVDESSNIPLKQVSAVIMNHSRPRMLQSSTILPTLISHPNVSEIFILHSNPRTRFEYIHPKVKNIDASHENDEMGLSLRFYFCQYATNEWVIILDDDIEFPESAISQLLSEFEKDSERIVGRYGRNLSSDSYWFYGYDSTNTHKETDVVLTVFMIMERNLCSSFFEYAHLIWDDIILEQGEGPLWNGEDIFMSLIAKHVYGQKNYAMDWLDVQNAPEELKDYDFGKLDISGGLRGYYFWDWHWWHSLLRRNRHYLYRDKLWRVAEERLNLLTIADTKALEN